MKTLISLFLILAACVLVYAKFPSQAFSVPAVMWSGSSDIAFAPQQACATSNLAQTVSDISASKKAKVVLAFVQRKMRMDEFLRHTGAFTASPNAALSSIKELIKNAPSAKTYSGCAADTQFSSALISKLANNDAVVINEIYETAVPLADNAHNVKALQLSTLLSALETDAASSLIAADKTNVFIILLENNDAAALNAYGARINAIASKFNALTAGSFVAVFTADAASKPNMPVVSAASAEEADVAAAGGRKLLSVLPPFNTTEAADLWIDHYTVECLLIGALLLFFAFAGFGLMHDLKTADHIVDIHDDKKHN